MKCLTDFIGIRGCGNAEPVSGLYINSLPGISLKSIDRLADEEQKSYAGVWADIQQRSLNKFGIEVTAAMAARYKLKSIQQHIVSSNYKLIDTGTIIAPSANVQGINLSLNNNESKLLSFYITRLRLYVVAAGTFDFTITDGENDELLWSKSVVVTSVGWQFIEVNALFNYRNINIGYNAATHSAATLPIDGFSDDCGCCEVLCECNENCTANISGFKGNELTGNESYGLVVYATLQCSFEPFVCENRQLFAVPLQYLMGSEIQLERIYSPRFNWTTANVEQAKELKDFYDVEYERALKIAVDGIEMELKDCCLICNESYRVVNKLP